MADGSGERDRAVGDGRASWCCPGPRSDGELWLLVETTTDLVGCPSCGVRAVGHGRSVVQVRDLPMGGRPVRLVWRKRRWRCRDPDCPTKTFTETSELGRGVAHHPGGQGDLSAGRRRRPQRGRGGPALRGRLALRLGGRRAPRTPLGHDPRRLHGVRALGVDEHKMLAAGPRHHTVYATQLVDLDRHRLLTW